MNTAYIALGSNISPRDSFLTQAVEKLNAHKRIEVIAKSSVYETEPVGYTDQGSFLNMVLEIYTQLQPLELLNYCQHIEQEQGRRREIRWGPRTIDLDILLFNQENIRTERLTVPHPRMHERPFVLIPLKEINPEIVLSGTNQRVVEILDKTSAQEKKGVLRWNPRNGEGV